MSPAPPPPESSGTGTPKFAGNFLTARWEKLLLLTYSVPEEKINPWLPPGIIPDLWNGQPHVSLVAFQFLRTRLKGIPVPFHRNFAEINLRIYVRETETAPDQEEPRRGVVFVRELVPRFMLAWVARTIYNEPYESCPLYYKAGQSGATEGHIEYGGRYKGKKFTIEATYDPTGAEMPLEKSPEHFFKEHEWGFGRARDGRTQVYRVEHPWWRAYPLKDFQLNFDFAHVYGEHWSFLNDRWPDHAMLAEGSPVAVYPAKKF